MKSFIALLFFVTCARALAAQRTWKGVLDKKGNYIPGSILVWAENANRAKKWADINGIPILTQWHDAVVNYDKSILANHKTDALGNFYIIPACLGLVQPYISNCKCRQWFADVEIGFGAVVRGLGLGTVSLKQANAYMIDRYPEFDRACGTICNYSPTPVHRETC